MSIYRFKIQNEMLNEKLIDFAQFHKYENNAQLKESFQTWIHDEDIKEMIEQETFYLQRMVYDLKQKSIATKLFTSIKYYHIKKATSILPKKQATHPKQRFQFDKTFIQLVQEYIMNHEGIKPSQLYDDFQIAHKHECNVQQEKAIQKGFEENQFSCKMKKMFKNKYFTITNR